MGGGGGGLPPKYMYSRYIPYCNRKAHLKKKTHLDNGKTENIASITELSSKII